MMSRRKLAFFLALGVQTALSGAGIGVALARAPAVSPAPAGVLATASQLEFERRVLRIVESAPMRAEIARVEALYAADPQGSTPTGKATIKRAAHSIAMAAAQYIASGDTDRPAAVWGVNAPHRWFGIDVPRSGFGIDNPDNVYRKIKLDGAARYEIYGRIKQPGPVELHFEMRDSIPGTGGMAAEGGQQLSTLRLDQMEVARDGSFTISVDSQPAGGRANHLQIPAQGKYLVIVRDLLTDWATQNPVALSVKRLDGPAIQPPATDEELIQGTVKLLAQIAPYWVAYDNKYVFTRPVNQFITPRVRPGGRGMSTSTHFRLAPDEAWVFTVDGRGAASLGVQLADPWGVAYEYAERSSSLNNAQARPNADGPYSFVVSRQDPGVYNWLDPEDHDAGIIAIRWQSLPAGATPENAIRNVAVVPLANLRAALPPETTFLSPQERKAQRSERAASHARRLGE